MNHHKLDNALASPGRGSFGGPPVTLRMAQYLEGLSRASMRLCRTAADVGLITPRLSVGIDIDDVLYPWYDTAHEICMAAGITNGRKPTTWAPHEEYECEHQAWIDALAGPTLDGSLYAAEPFSGVQEQLGRLRTEGHYVHLVTARGAWQHSEAVRAHTAAWVDKHAIPHDSLTFAQSKAGAGSFDFFLDDHVRNYNELDAAGVNVYLHTRPWNAQVDDARRVPTLKAFVDLVLEAA